MKKYLVVSLVFAALVSVNPQEFFAAEMPAFSTCVAPTGSIKANYESGIHGVPGDTNAYSGKDKVYKITDTYTLQCFCPDNGNGIQTDWVKAAAFSSDEIKIYTNQGYVYIPDGAAWGLDSAPYLAKNSGYSCKGNGSGGSSPSSSSSSSSNVGGASASNPSTGSVLGLASTGNSLFVLSVFTAGIASTLTGFVMRKKV